MPPRARSYVSSVRRRGADETRSKIADAARALFAKQGIDGTTIDAIAEDAGVAAQTVYAIFGSKRGIIAELMDRARFGPAYVAQVDRTQAAVDGASRLRLVAGVARRIYDAERAEIEVLRGASAMSPELGVMEREKEGSRYEAQGKSIELLVKEKSLKKGLPEVRARDILWTLTGRETYRMLTVERGWSSDEYEEWVGNALVLVLVEPNKAKPKATKKRAAKKAESSPRAASARAGKSGPSKKR